MENVLALWPKKIDMRKYILNNCNIFCFFQSQQSSIDFRTSQMSKILAKVQKDLADLTFLDPCEDFNCENDRQRDVFTRKRKKYW